MNFFLIFLLLVIVFQLLDAVTTWWGIGIGLRYFHLIENTIYSS